MRKVLGALGAIIGLVAVAAGVLGIVVVGSDNVLGSEPHTVYGNSQVAVSSPKLLAFSGGSLVVTAANPVGKVFLGTANPVEIASLTSGVTTYTINEASRGGLSGALLQSKAAAPVADPSKLTIWSGMATGSGTQRLTVPLDGTVKQLYAGPVGKGGPLTMSVGTVIEHAYAGSIAALVIGLLLLVGGGLLGLRRGRGVGPTASQTGTPVGSRSVDGATADAAPRLERGAVRPHLRLLAFGVPVALLSACGVTPTAVPAWDPKTISMPSLTAPGAIALWKAYDRDNNAAIKAAAAPGYSATGWAAVDTDAVLLADRYETARDKLARDMTKPSVNTHAPVALYSPSARAYPLVAVLAASVTSTSAKADAKNVQLSVMRKTSVAAAWQMAAAVAVPRAGLPPALAPDAATPTSADLKRAAAVAAALGSYLSLHTSPGVTPDANLSHWRTSIDALVKKGTGVSGTVVPTLYPDDSQVTGKPVAPSVVRVKGGLLMVSAHRAIGTFHASNDSTLSISDKYQAALTGQAGELSSIVYSWLITTATFVPDKGTPKVLGSSFAFTI